METSDNFCESLFHVFLNIEVTKASCYCDQDSRQNF